MSMSSSNLTQCRPAAPRLAREAKASSHRWRDIALLGLLFAFVIAGFAALARRHWKQNQTSTDAAKRHNNLPFKAGP
jgi:hypothetical protein